MKIKSIFIFLLLLLIAAAIMPALLFSSHHEVIENSTPESPENVYEVGLDLRTMLKLGSFNPYMELKGRWEDDPIEFRYRHIMIGTYYRLSRHVKIGGFYQYQKGARHDDDWKQFGTGWNWDNTRDRGESVIIFDVTPRFQMGFMPGDTWLFMFKTRYLYNTYNNHQTLKLRPGVTYFLMPARDPLLNISLNWELYLALNYSDGLLYSQWPYLEILYHLSPNVKLSGGAGYRVINWSTSQDVRDNGEPSYEVKYRAVTLNAGVNLHFDL